MPGPASGPLADAIGLAALEASLASNLQRAIPTEHDSFRSSLTSARIASAISMLEPNSRWPPDTSRNASSNEIGSMSGVNTSKRTEEHTSELQSLRHLVCR